jgi:putative alpha-1,2-mannosidase
VIRAYLEKYFSDRRSGIPGNDDSGAMSSWFLFQSIGFYPNAGQDIYLIGTPSYPEVDIRLGSGEVLRVVAENLDSEHINRYVQSATLNGKPLATSWFRHAQIKHGGLLRLRMGSAPSDWGKVNPPPSVSSGTTSLCAAALQR